MAMKCPKCSTPNPPDSKFCKECATPLPSSREVGLSQTETLLPPQEDLTTGTIFAGRYQVIEELGHGGMGKVYKVFDRETDSKVALKLIKPEVAADRNTIERFRNELKIARDISHKHICRMYDLGRDADNYFITMEYVSGEDLRGLIRRTRRLDIGTAISIAKQVCEGLAEAHRLGVVHRDLKPSNIMIDREGDAKIMDFGIARSLRTKGITGPGVVIGTPEYMSPEQVDGKEADERADLYSLSIIFYEMVTGTVPFEGETAFSIGLKHKNEPPENPKKLNPQIPDDLSRLILKGLEKDREKRYQTAAEVLSELIRIEHGLPTTEKAVIKSRPTTSKGVTVHFRKNKLLIPVIVLAVVALGAVLFVFLSNRQTPTQPIIPTHRQLTFTGEADKSAISPDGKFIAYMTGPLRELKKLCVQDMVSGRSLEVFNASGFTELLWTPDGSEITVSAMKDAEFGTFLVPRLGGPPRQIQPFAHIAWSPEYSQFAGAAQVGKEITIVNRLTGKSTSFDLSGPIEYLLDIDWSPSGDRLLVLTANKELEFSLLTIKPDGSQQKLVIEDKDAISSPRWASKGDAIFCLRGWTWGQPSELWKLPIARDTGKPEKIGSIVLSGIPMGEFFSLSADGKYFLYTRGSEFSNIWLAKIEGSDKGRTVKTQQITSGTSLRDMPSISPDGKRIAFSGGTLESANIYVMPIEGGDSTQLTFLNSRNVNPVWSPDGTEIAFCSDEGGTYKVWKVGSQGGRPHQFVKTELNQWGEIVWAPMPDIMYCKKESRSVQILNPKTEDETPLVKDEPVYWLYPPVYSPDLKKVAVLWSKAPSFGIWVISLEDASKKFIGAEGEKQPIGWSADGKWIYAQEKEGGKAGYLMIEVESGKTMPLPTMPFIINGKTYQKLIDEKPSAFVDLRIQSDVWVIENFDQIIKQKGG